MIILLFNQTVLFLFIQGLFQSFCPQNISLLRNLRLWLKLMPNIKEKKTSYKTIYCYAVMVEYTPLERSSLSSLICQPVVFFFSIYSSSNFIRAVVPLIHNAHFSPVSLYALKKGRVHALVRLVYKFIFLQLFET